MIKEILSKDLNLNKLHSSYLINVDDLEAAIKEVFEFIGNNLYQKQHPEKHGDFMLVKKTTEKAKNISVEQIRSLQNFLNKTSILSGYKTSIILEAEQMNINAMNSCLKLLEEPPRNSYIFLITNNASAILPTISSRCIKIKHRYLSNRNEKQNKPIADYYIKPLLKNTKFDEHLLYLKDFAAKDRKLWLDFTNNIQNLLTRISCKLIYKEDDSIRLSLLEEEFFKELSPISLSTINKKYEKLAKLIKNTIDFDLDLRASYILLIKQIF